MLSLKRSLITLTNLLIAKYYIYYLCKYEICSGLKMHIAEINTVHQCKYQGTDSTRVSE